MKRPIPRHLEFLIVPLSIVCLSAQARAADDPSPTAAMAVSSTQGAPASRWTYDFESSYVFWNIQNPFWLLAGQRGVNNMKNPWHYHLNSYVFGGRYDLTNIGGLRYLFVPGDGSWSPYVEFREGVGATDASHLFYGQQDDVSLQRLAQRAGQEGQRDIHPVIDIGMGIIELLVAVFDTRELQALRQGARAVVDVVLVA